MSYRSWLRTLLLLLSCASAACEPWVPETFPVPVDLADDLSKEQRKATLEACESWNGALGAEVLRPVPGNGRLIQRGRIQVHDQPPRRGEIATTHTNAWHCEISVGGLGYDPSTLVHELGHCFGLGHDTMGSSIMAEQAQPGQRLLPEHVEYVRELMDLPEVP